jgi:hypothetical protein
MKSLQKKHDWLGFLTREIPIAVLAAVWLFERLMKGDIAGAIVLAGLGFVFISIGNYLWTRFQ